jgi:hypothetical protein
MVDSEGEGSRIMSSTPTTPASSNEAAAMPAGGCSAARVLPDFLELPLEDAEEEDEAAADALAPPYVCRWCSAQ